MITYKFTYDKTIGVFLRKVTKMIYLDHAATTKIDKEVLHVFNEASERYYGNASSLHDLGTEANQALEQARIALAQTIGAESEEVVFTSGGTEANQLAILTLLNSVKKKGKHLLTTRIEHSSIYNLFQKLEKEGYEVTYLTVDESGLVSLEEIKQEIRKDTVLAAIQHVNSEIGVIQNIKSIGKILTKEKILFHSDLIQSYGKINLNVKALNLSSAAISSHKIYGPKGIGMTYFSKAINYHPYHFQATHEYGFRPGTVDVPSVLSFAYAGQTAMRNIENNQNRAIKLRHLFESRVKEVEDISVHSHETNQLPDIIGVSITGIQGQYAMLECNRHSIAISTGTACQIGQTTPSRTMISMGKSDVEAKELIRISTGNQTKEKEINDLADVLIELSKEMIV